MHSIEFWRLFGVNIKFCWITNNVANTNLFSRKIGCTQFRVANAIFVVTLLNH